MIVAGTAPTRVLVVTGESSGEQHTAGLMDALFEQAPERNFEFRGTGGRLLEERGVRLLADTRDLAAIGPLAALSNLSKYLSTFRRLVRMAEAWRPRIALLVDFPEFNLRLAKRLAGIGIPVCYFISPQLWAWREGRVKSVRRHVDMMLVILPFEEHFYRSHGIEAHFVGHPSVHLRSYRKQSHQPSSRPLIGLMPGSRRGEIEKMLRLFLEAARLIAVRLPADFRVLVGPDLDLRQIQQRARQLQAATDSPLSLEVRQGPVEELLPDCDYAIIKSGTSTLQSLILEVPFSMVYRMSALSYCMLRPLVSARSYCLANLIAGEPIVPEFVQRRARPELIAEHALSLLQAPLKWKQLKQNLKNASEKLGTKDAYRRAAGYLIDLLEDSCES